MVLWCPTPERHDKPLERLPVLGQQSQGDSDPGPPYIRRRRLPAPGLPHCWGITLGYCAGGHPHRDPCQAVLLCCLLTVHRKERKSEWESSRWEKTLITRDGGSIDLCPSSGTNHWATFGWVAPPIGHLEETHAGTGSHMILSMVYNTIENFKKKVLIKIYMKANNTAALSSDIKHYDQNKVL